jgi:hypothetical protein
MISLIVLVAIVDPVLAGKILAWAAAVGMLGTAAQALLQKAWWDPKIKAVIRVVIAVVLGVGSYLLASGLEGDFSNPIYLVSFILGAYGAIQIAYGSLKVPVIDKLEKKGVGAGETPKGQLDPNELEDEDGFKSEVPDPYGPNGEGERP